MLLVRSLLCCNYILHVFSNIKLQGPGSLWSIDSVLVQVLEVAVLNVPLNLRKMLIQKLPSYYLHLAVSPKTHYFTTTFTRIKPKLLRQLFHMNSVDESSVFRTILRKLFSENVFQSTFFRVQFNLNCVTEAWGSTS